VAPQREWFEKDYYEVLGLAPGATDKDITRAYRKLAKQNHPDANSGDKAAEARFKEISAANDVLSDPAKRKEYDQVREMVASGAGMGGFGGGFRPGGADGATYTFDDGGGLGDLLGNLFGGSGRSRGGRRGRAPAGPQRGRDLETELTLDFLDAVHGITTTVHLNGEAVCSTCGGSGAKPGTVPDICPTCAGSGEILVDQGPFSFAQVCGTCGGRGRVVTDKCPTCRGRGVEIRAREVKVRIPAGVKDGQRIKIAGRGAPGANGAPPGDLFVVVHVTPHLVFGRSGRHDLTVKVPITFAEAALGAQVKVPTLDAPVTVKVPAGTHSGKTVRVRDRGIHPAKGAAGDLLVTFDVDVPEHLTDEQRQAVEALAAALPTNPRQHLGL
jgi:molecular chaperone DnaJ